MNYSHANFHQQYKTTLNNDCVEYLKYCKSDFACGNYIYKNSDYDECETCRTMDYC